MLCSRMTTRFGDLLIAGESPGTVQRIQFIDGPAPAGWAAAPRAFDAAREQLAAYLDGGLQRFDLDLDLRGTPFQLQVWRALEGVPYGQTTGYADLAARIGNPGAARAVGMVLGQNPIPVVVPCHRVVGADGSMTGFGGGIRWKRALLGLERDQVSRQVRLPW